MIIITLFGPPASGKTDTIKRCIESLKKQGITAVNNENGRYDAHNTGHPRGEKLSDTPAQVMFQSQHAAEFSIDAAHNRDALWDRVSATVRQCRQASEDAFRDAQARHMHAAEAYEAAEALRPKPEPVRPHAVAKKAFDAILDDLRDVTPERATVITAALVAMIGEAVKTAQGHTHDGFVFQKLMIISLGQMINVEGAA